MDGKTVLQMLESTFKQLAVRVMLNEAKEEFKKGVIENLKTYECEEALKEEIVETFIEGLKEVLEEIKQGNK